MTSISTENFEIFKRIQPHEYLKRFLDQNVRPDGRLLNEFRKTMITTNAISTANASGMIRLGGTTVVCGIKAEVCEPKVNIPNQGYLVPNVELSPLCSPKFKPGAPSDKAQSVSEFISQLLNKSSVFPLEKLCIEEGKAVWVLYADIVCLNYDGNILDASLLALMVALKNCKYQPIKLPKAEVSPAMVVEADAMETVDIELNRFPVSSTFTLFNNCILSDPNDTEESLSQEVVTIVIDLFSGDILKLYKNGGTALSAKELKTCIQHARSRTNEIKSFIQ